jgi:hypothetical protein
MQTLNSYSQRPLVRRFDMTKVPLAKIAPITKKWHDDEAEVGPDEWAFRYYFAAHWFNYVSAEFHPDQPLGEWAPLVQNFYDEGTNLAERMFHYLILICTRETRHASIHPSRLVTMRKKFGDGSMLYFENYQGTSKPKACDTLWNSEKYWPGVDMGVYTEWMEWVFKRGAFNGGFGGQAWAEVAAVLRRLVHGEITYEMMVDQAFNSAHNNGPIFNKGMLFSGYSHKFKTILDVQRAGQIPYLFEEEMTHGKRWFDIRPSTTYKLYEEYRALMFPTMDRTYVDWREVRNLGAVTALHSYIKYQNDTYGQTPEELAKAEAAAKAKPVSFEVMPHVEVPKLKRNEHGQFVPYTVGDQLAENAA